MTNPNLPAATFDAAVVADLAYTFDKFRPDPDALGLSDEERDRRKRLADLHWKGVVPEPDDVKLSRLFDAALPDIDLERLQRIDALTEQQRAARVEWWRQQPHEDGAEEPAGDDVEVPVQWQRGEQAEYAEMLVALREESRRRTATALAEFCGNQPEAEVLLELPFRVLQHFLGWITGQFRPETLAAVINR